MPETELFHDPVLGDCRMDRSQNGALLLQPKTGATLLVSRELGSRIVGGGLDSDLLRVLASRGFDFSDAPATTASKVVDPRFFMVDLTRACSNRCAYCFRQLRQAERIDDGMLDRILRKIIEHCRREGLTQITLQAWGGEPLLAWNSVCRMQDTLRGAGIDARMLIETNGVSVTPAIAREMYARGILCSVSIDGPARIHDCNRLLAGGGGSHAAAVRGLELLRAAGYGRRVGAVCVVTRDSLPDLPEIVDYFANVLKLPRVKMNVVKDSPQMRDKSICLTTGEVACFWRTLLHELVAINRTDVSFGESTVVGLLHNLTTHRPVSFCHSRGCQSGCRMLSFGMEGGVYPCDLTDCSQLRLGDVHSSESLTGMVSRQVSSHPFLNMRLPAECAGCWWRTFCGGGCTSMRLQNGNGGPDRADCIRNGTLYPLLIDLILNEPQVVCSLSGGEITIA